MEQLSDSDATMLANQNFETVLRSIRISGLNYYIQASPFSATISLRKTLIKDINGSYVTPQTFQGEDSNLLRQISVLEDELRSLRLKYAEALSDNTTLQNIITDRDTVINDIIFTRKAKKEATRLGCFGVTAMLS